MPLYEYQCEACGHRFEVIQKFSDPPVETCPRCHGAVRKLLSSPAIQFKGSGWYITDYAKKDSSGAPATSDTKTETKTETTTETKTDSAPSKPASS
jgi:putative FmdB family regulatory protein